MGTAEVPKRPASAEPGRRQPHPTDEQAEILALVAPLRRFALSRLQDVHDADDVVQETLTRMLEARGRLEDETLTDYAFAVARNLIATQHREAELRRRHAPRLVDLSEPAQPEHLVLADEERKALATALRDLPQRQRDQLIEHVVYETAVTELGERTGTGKIAAQLARTRARLRLDYLLALRGVTLPTARCRPVLLAVSAADRRRQAALRAGDHLANCHTCFELSDPLRRRRRALAGFVPWIPLGAWHGHLARWVRAHPAQSLTGSALTAAAAAVAATAVIITSPAHQHPAAVPIASAAPAASSASSAPMPSAPPDTSLTGPGGPVLPVAGALANLAGRLVQAHGVRVLAVPADEGFWVGDGPGHRVWVRLLTRAESAEAIRLGQRLSFTGVVVRHDRGFVRRLGLSDAEGALELSRQAAHVEVGADDVTIH
jgi:RNA polymerase sigma factor (sigma-70 family)